MDRLRTPRVAGWMLACELAAFAGWTGCGPAANSPAESGPPAATAAETGESPRLLTDVKLNSPQIKLAAWPADAGPAGASNVGPSDPFDSDTFQYGNSFPMRLAQLGPIPLGSDGPELTPPEAKPAEPRPTEPKPAAAPSPPSSAWPRAAPSAWPAEVDAKPVAPSIVAPAEPLRFTARPTRRTPEMDAVIRRAEALNRHAFELAGHGAIYSARSEFIQAMQTVADALDAQQGESCHRRMLAAGLQALRELDDFGRRSAEPGRDADIAAIVAGHQTPVLKNELPESLTATTATARYLTYAQEQLAASVADIPPGSAALYGLGRIFTVPESAHGPVDPTHGAKAIALHQAALMVDGRNYPAANELGVLLVQFGELPAARAAFLQSLSVAGQPVTWRNLSAVSAAMGDRPGADQAQREASLATSRQNGAAGQFAGPGGPVQWMDPATFARTTPFNIDATPGSQPGPGNPFEPQQKSVATSPYTAPAKY